MTRNQMLKELQIAKAHVQHVRQHDVAWFTPKNRLDFALQAISKVQESLREESDDA